MPKPFQMIASITSDQLRDLIKASIDDLPDWQPSFGLTEPQTAFSQAASPQMVLAILDQLDEARNGMRYQPIMRLKKELERLREESKTLRSFANEILGVAFEGGSLDGADLQDIGVRCEVLTVREVEERCGEICACAAYGFPSECYRKSPIVTGCRDASDSTNTEKLTNQ